MISSLPNHTAVGKVRDSHGLKGELFIVTNLNKTPEWVEKIQEFSLQFKAPNEEGKHQDSYGTFKVKKARPHKKGFIIKTDEIEDRNASDVYKGAVFYISNEYLETQKGEEIYLTEIKNFDVYDGQNLLGKVVSFSTNKAQDLIVVEMGEKNVEIPLVKEFVKSIDYANHTIHMTLPEGLY